MWGLILSVATIVASTLTQSKQLKEGSSSNSSTMTTTMMQVGPEAKLFLSGVVFTMGAQYVYQWLSQNSQYQRMKLMMYALIGGVSNKAELPFRKPSSIVEKGNRQLQSDQHKVLQNKHGSVVELITPKLASISSSPTSLHISILSIEPRNELPSQQSSPFLEFYYVLSGSGLLSQQGIVETMTLVRGDVFVVDPLAVRWISNKNGTKPLVLLRVTDAGSLYSKAHWNQIRLDPSVNYSTYLAVSQGLQKVLGGNSISSNTSSGSDTPIQDNTGRG